MTVELLGGKHVLDVELNVNPAGQVTQLLLLGPEQVKQLESHLIHIMMELF
jgi:hypothetical protein